MKGSSGMDYQEVVTLLETNYRLLGESNAKWLDKRVKYLLARIFTGQGIELPVADFDWLDIALGHKSGVFTSLTKVTRHTLTGLMIASGKNSVEGIEELYFNKKILKDCGFKSSNSTYFAAYQLYLSDSKKREEIARRGQSIYQGIKLNHPIITSTNDYSSIISLAQAEQLAHLTEDELCQLIDYYFESFQEIGLKNRNSCLVAATLTTLMLGEMDEAFITSLKYVITHFEANKIKIKNVHLVPLISLTYLDKETQAIDLSEMFTFIEEINQNVKLLFETDYKEALAISLYVESKSRALNKAHLTTLSVSLNQIIVQEQTMLANNATVLLS